MEISLSPEVEHFVNERVKSGHYKTASEFVNAALREAEADSVAEAELREKLLAAAQQAV